MQVQPQQSGALSGGVREWRTAGGQTPCRQCGLTLVELMVTVAVAAVLLMIAVPSFKNITLSNRLDTAANDLVNAINVARMEAIKRNTSTQFCSNAASANTNDLLGNACGVEAGAVRVMRGSVADGNPVLAGVTSLVPPIQINGNLTALRFSAQGQARKVGDAVPSEEMVVADICTSQMSRDNHRQITMRAGSILATATSTADCPSS
jgi:type IV fimbrial biogenesis protein FimT